MAEGSVNPDEYRLYKPFIDQQGKDPIVGKQPGSKQRRKLYPDDAESPICQEVTDYLDQHHYALTNQQIVRLATLAMAAEEHAREPMEIEWTHDATKDNFTITSAEKILTPLPDRLDPIILSEIHPSPVHSLLCGSAIGSQIIQGEISLISDLSNQDSFRPGSILVTRQVDDSWLPLLEKASGLITDLGGRVCQAATLCRELEIPAILGTTHATPPTQILPKSHPRLLRSGARGRLS